MIILVGFSVYLVFPLVIPLIFPLVFIVFITGSTPFLTMDRVSLFVFRGSSTCVIVLVGLSDSLVFPLVISLVFFAGSAPFVKDRPYRVPPYIILVS